MPGISRNTAVKHMSRTKRVAIAKNEKRTDAAINLNLESCTFGKVSKALGNKMFTIINTEKHEHLAYIRGKMARVETGHVVLLSVREYESRSKSEKAVYDIMGVFTPKQVTQLIKAKQAPAWMLSLPDAEYDDEDSNIFDFDECDKDGDNDSDVDIDDI